MSYSRIKTFEECQRGFYLSYVINDIEKIGNAYSQYGTLMHNIIDRWAKGEYKKDELAKIFSSKYDKEVTLNFPESIRDTKQEYFNAGYDYFADFESVIKNGTILESEKEYHVDLCGTDFTGIIDMVVQAEDGRIMIVDHKTSSRKSFYGKQLREKAKQLYLYAEIYKITHGKYPDILVFNLLRDNVQLPIEFSMTDLKETIDWADEKIGDIKYMIEHFSGDINEWSKKKEDSRYCRWLCDVSMSCI